MTIAVAGDCVLGCSLAVRYAQTEGGWHPTLADDEKGRAGGVSRVCVCVCRAGRLDTGGRA